MARLYLTPSELQELPLGIGLAGYIAMLNPGVLDKMLFRASQSVDSFCKRRLGAPLSTTLAGVVSAGGTQLSVASTLGFDDLAEQSVILNPGQSNQEILPIQSGGVQITSFTPPYPGTITLATPCMFGHAQSENVQGCYQETTQIGNASNSDPYTESIQTQSAQLALAHLPPLHPNLARVVFTKTYPIQNITKVETAYSFDNAFEVQDLSGVTIIAAEGWYRFRVGQVLIPEGAVRTTYAGGYSTIPDDVKEATSYYLAEQMRLMVNPFGATDLQEGRGRKAMPLNKDGKSPLVQQAEAALMRYRRTV